jgi:hypothetical protein
MIETLILGFLLGAICTTGGAAYAVHKWSKEPFVLKKFDSGYEVLASDLNFEGDPSGYIGLKKDGKLIAGMKYDNNGVTDIVYDI